MEDGEEKKNVFISYLDDDGKKKQVWTDEVRKYPNYVSFRYNDKTIDVPWLRVLKIKEEE